LEVKKMKLTIIHLKYLLSKTKFNIVKREGCTAILTSEIEEDSNRLSRFGVEEFVADGVIRLEYSSIGERRFGVIEIRKMRRTEHAHGTFDIQITQKGLEILTDRGHTIPMK